MKNLFINAFWLLWILSCLILLATLNTALEITQLFLRNGMIVFFILGIANAIVSYKGYSFRVRLLSSVLVVIVAMVAIYSVFAWNDLWKSQKILYQKLHCSNRRIELQYRGGMLGAIEVRFIDRLELTPFLSSVKKMTEEEIEKMDSLQWRQVTPLSKTTTQTLGTTTP